MSDCIKGRFRIVTPMFLGGSTPANVDGIRPPSIKGALRYWWRALNWARLRRDCEHDEGALRALSREERLLFGAASRDKGGGQSRVLLRVRTGSISSGQPNGEKLPVGLPYLLGQGLYHFRNGFLREAILKGDFEVELRFHPQLSWDHRKQVADSLLAWGCLGGLGSRMRRGLGSVAIESLEGDERHPPQGPEEMEEILKGILPEDGPFPPISAFSHLSRVDLSLQGKDPWRLLAQAGEEFQFYRSWGRDGKVNGKPAERNFQEDHDLAKAAANGEKVSTLPQRSLFGLPHNYFFSSDKTKLDIAPAGKGRTRRASPLWMHAHQFPDGSAAVIHTLLPAQFLPEGEPVQMKPKGRPEKVGWKQPDSWEVVERYLNRFTQRKSLRPSQGGVQ